MDTTIRLMRAQLDALDDELIELVATRMAVSTQLQQMKRDAGIAAFDARREAAIVARLCDVAGDYGLPTSGTLRLIEALLSMMKEAPAPRYRTRARRPTLGMPPP